MTNYQIGYNFGTITCLNKEYLDAAEFAKDKCIPKKLLSSHIADREVIDILKYFQTHIRYLHGLNED